MEKPLTETFQGKTLYKWHSGAPDDESYDKGLAELTEAINNLALKLGVEKIQIPENKSEGKPITKLDKEFVTEAYGEALVELAKTNKKFVVLDGDLSADCKLRNFEKTYPDRFIENGIAEQDMVSMAGGLARMGLIPIVNTFASFLAARANEHIYNNAGEKTKIIYTCHFSGMIPAGPGKSHPERVLGKASTTLISRKANDFVRALRSALPVIVPPCEMWLGEFGMRNDDGRMTATSENSALRNPNSKFSIFDLRREAIQSASARAPARPAARRRRIAALGASTPLVT